MNKHERVPIVRKEWGTIYGRVIDHKGKLGRYEVISEHFGHDGNVYNLFSDAEKKMDTLEVLFDKKSRNQQ